jgi:hypothetical protein
MENVINIIISTKFVWLVLQLGVLTVLTLYLLLTTNYSCNRRATGLCTSVYNKSSHTCFFFLELVQVSIFGTKLRLKKNLTCYNYSLTHLMVMFVVSSHATVFAWCISASLLPNKSRVSPPVTWTRQPPGR